MADKKTRLSEDELGAPVQRPGGRPDLKAGHVNGLGAVDGKPDVDGDDAGAQYVGHARVGCCDFFETVGCTGSWRGAGRDITRHALT